MGPTILLAVLLLTSFSAYAQQEDTGVGILTFAGGGIFGIGGHGSAGASIADAVTKHVVPFVDFSYSPLSSYAFTYGATNQGKGLYTSSLVDVNGGIKIRFPTTRDWVPYIGLGAGLLHFASSTYSSGYNTTGTVKESNNEAAGNISTGALYYISKHAGLGMELKGYLAQHNHFGRASAGVFFQFP